MSLLYGSRKSRLEQIKEPGIKQYIEKDPRTYEPTSFNEFENLNRGQYKKIFMECPNLRRAIFERVMGSDYQSRYESFFEAFGDYNIITSHLKMDSITPQDQSRINQYIIQAVEFIKKINIAYLKMLSDFFYIKNEGPPDVVLFFSLRGIKGEQANTKVFKLNDKILADISDLKPVKTDIKEIERIFTTLKNIGNGEKYQLDLEDYNLIERLFTTEYRNFVAVLSYLTFAGKIKIGKKLGSIVFIYTLEGNK
jgi:hypothetical protein